MGFTRQPHFVRGQGGVEDPEFRASSLVGFDYPDEFGDQAPVSLTRWAESLFDAPLELRYTGLDPAARYKVRFVEAGDSARRATRLVANGRFEIHPLRKKDAEVKPVEFDIPAEATASGTLTLEWQPDPAESGNGRWVQISEVWLMRR